MNKTLFNNEVCSGSITDQGDGDIQIDGRINSLGNGKLYYWAAAPPTYGTSFSGSGHPYANPIMAYDQTTNKGLVETKNGNFTIRIKYPNAYYVGLGSLYVPPHVNFKMCSNGSEDKYFSVKIDNGIPFRTLTYPSPPSNKPRISPMFYYECEKGARSQEQILRASGYPDVNVMPDNFWGDRPPR
tara:strand:+ start:2242 stop:2796 length:555 start_codon:yes stop_codon:yes gene_type:complete